MGLVFTAFRRVFASVFVAMIVSAPRTCSVFRSPLPQEPSGCAMMTTQTVLPPVGLRAPRAAAALSVVQTIVTRVIVTEAPCFTWAVRLTFKAQYSLT